MAGEPSSLSLQYRHCKQTGSTVNLRLLGSEVRRALVHSPPDAKLHTPTRRVCPSRLVNVTLSARQIAMGC